jgi:polysaccharide biosynthesis protein PslH
VVDVVPVTVVRSLLVLPQPPAAEGGAPERCSLGLVLGLREHGIEPRVLAAHQAFTPTYPRPDLPGLEVVEVSPVDVDWRHRLVNLRPPHGDLARASEFADRVREASRSVDVVHLDQIDTARCGSKVSGVAVAVGLHYRALLDQDLRLSVRRPARRHLEFVRAERAAIRGHRWIVVNSSRVADSVRPLAPGAEIVVVPLCLDPDGYEPEEAAARPGTAGLIGTGVWPPTADAIRRLLGGLWADVRRRVPGATLELAGRSLPDVGGDGVRRLGEVPSAADFLRSLSVLAYPVGRGSGMKVKVLEALALGVPVVTTPDGAEGIPPTDGIVVATDDATLAAALAGLLSDPDERAERSRAARATFLASLSPGPATEPLADLYRRMAASVTTGGSGRGRR